MELSDERLRKLAELEDGCDVSVGGLAVDLGLYKAEPELKPKPLGLEPWQAGPWACPDLYRKSDES